MFLSSLAHLFLLLWFAGRIHGDAQIIFTAEEGGADCHNAVNIRLSDYLSFTDIKQCTSLVNVLGGKVYYQEIPPAYFDAYFSTQQREVVPACLVLPNSAQDVSDAIKVITQYQCIFGVKSGGHAMFTGGSNVPGGITIDLRNLNSLQISEDRKLASIGPGNRWEAVSDFLDPFNATVVGGRNSGVGVGGFLLGGGISFVSRRYGWGADNVQNYEVSSFRNSAF